MFKKVFMSFTLLVLFMAGVTPAAAQTASRQTEEFVRSAAIGNQFKIESSQLALKQTTLPSIREFAQMMVTEHTHAGDEMKKALAASGLTLALPEELDEKHAKLLGSLKAATPENFNDQYVRAQSDAHEEALALFRAYATNGDNDEINEFAENTLPILEAHQEKINNLNLIYMSGK